MIFRSATEHPPLRKPREIARLDQGWKLMSDGEPVFFAVTRRFDHDTIEVRVHLDWKPDRGRWAWQAWPMRPELADVLRETGEIDDFVLALKGAERAACAVRTAVRRHDQGSLVAS